MMTSDQVKEYTKQRVRECSCNQESARAKWKSGLISLTEYKAFYTTMEAKKRAYQSMCAAVID